MKAGSVAAAFRTVGLALILAVMASAGAEAAEVTLRLKGGGFQLTGELKEYDTTKYVIENRSFGTMTLDASRFDCIGQGCPRAPFAAPAALNLARGTSRTIRIHGSDVVGAELMPLLVQGYANSIGAKAVRAVGANPLEMQIRLTDANDREITLVELHRYGTDQAFQGLANGSVEIVMADRPVTEDEVAMLARAGLTDIRSPAHEHVIALDGLAIVVSEDNPAVSLSIENIARIFAGELTDWSEIGLPPGHINVYATESHSGTFSVFDALVLKPRNLTLTREAQIIDSNSGVSDAVARDPNGIGLTSFAFLRNAKAINIESSCGLITRPSVFTVKTEEYPLTRRIYLYSGILTNPHARGLIDYIFSSAAQSQIAAAQFVDQTPDLLGFEDQGGRIAYALNAPSEDFDMGMMRQLISDMNGAQRLSITFRFRLGSVDLDARARADIDRLIEVMRTPEFANKSVLLLGYADSVGQFASNSALSQRRAAQVHETLLAAAGNTINPAFISSRGYSELAPVACNDSVEGRNLNRRVEVWVRE